MFWMPRAEVGHETAGEIPPELLVPEYLPGGLLRAVDTDESKAACHEVNPAGDTRADPAGRLLDRAGGERNLLEWPTALSLPRAGLSPAPALFRRRRSDW